MGTAALAPTAATGTSDRSEASLAEDHRVLGALRFSDGTPAWGVPLTLSSQDGADIQESVTASDGRFIFPVKHIPRHVVIAVQGLTTSHALEPGHSGAYDWDIGTITIPDVCRMQLRIAVAKSALVVLESGGDATVLVEVRDAAAASGSKPVASISVPLSRADGWSQTVWIPSLPSISVAWGMSFHHSPFPIWVERLDRQVDRPRRCYPDVDVVLDSGRLIAGEVVQENGSAVAQATVTIHYKTVGGRNRLCKTRTDSNGRFVFPVPAAAAGGIWAQVGGQRGDEQQWVGGQAIRLFVGLANQVRVELRDDMGAPVPKYFVGTFHVGRRGLGAEHPLAFLQRDWAGGVANLGTDRVSSGERWFVFSPHQGEMLWTPASDLLGGAAPHALATRDMTRSSLWRLRLGSDVPLGGDAEVRVMITERERTKPVRYDITLDGNGREFALASILNLNYSCELMHNKSVIARGMVDTRSCGGSDVVVELQKAN